jgi:chemotaxis protein CheY-P-specific phosphatase CheC
MEPEMKSKDLDRWCELTSIGSGHAAIAFSQLTGREIHMGPPRVFCGDDAESCEDPAVAEEWCSGVIFEFDGCIEALVAIMFRESMRDSVVRQLLGNDEEPLPRESVESVLMEVGNILASVVASSIADTLGERLLPSIPILAMEHAQRELAELAVRRSGHFEERIECELLEPGGEMGGLLILVPERR